MHKLTKHVFAVGVCAMLVTGTARAQDNTFNVWWFEDPKARKASPGPRRSTNSRPRTRT